MFDVSASRHIGVCAANVVKFTWKMDYKASYWKVSLNL